MSIFYFIFYFENPGLHEITYHEHLLRKKIKLNNLSICQITNVVLHSIPNRCQ